MREFISSATLLWQQAYLFDRYGNRTIDVANTTDGIPKPNFAVNASNNRLAVPSGQSGTMSYDSVGNLTTDTYSAAAVTRTYDAENRMTSETQASSYVAGTYSYDGDGHRVKRNIGGTETWQVYGLGGELIAEYAQNGSALTPQKEYGYRNGQLLVTATVTPGWGSVPTLNDNPLSVGQTTVQARHITELHDAINSLRSHMGMSSYSWQYSATTNDYLSANPILEMRTALDQALGAPAGGYAAGLAQGQAVKAVHIQELRDRLTAASSSDVRWLVTDQLGTPRMIFDQTGSLANESRHDYLPFGEELFAAQGARASAQGYTANDGVRQHFTGHERDNETGLDFMQARYYTNTLGRFTSADTMLGSISNPQTLNRYAYVGNNPLNFSDPTGHRPSSSPTYSPTFNEGDGGYSWDDPNNPNAVLASLGGLPERYENEISDWAHQDEAAHDARVDQAISALFDLGQSDGQATASIDVMGGDGPGAPQNSDQQYASDSTMLIDWDKSGWWANPLSYEGHVSYITMQNDTSYSFQSPFQWTYDQPSSKYTNQRSTHTAGTGFILDFSHAGAEINAKFQKALLSARRGDIYDPFDNNCANPFVVAINAIHKQIGTPEFTTKHMPIDVKDYIEKYLVPKGYVAGAQLFPKH